MTHSYKGEESPEEDSEEYAKGYIVLVIKVKFAMKKSIATALQQVQGEFWITVF